MSPLTSLLSVLSLVVIGAQVVADPPKFYQPLPVRDPAAASRDLLSQGWKLRAEPPLQLAPPIDWAMNAETDSNWNFQLNAMYPLAPVFVELARAYDPDLHRFARSIFEDWIHFSIELDTDHRFRWHDMSTGIRAAYLAQLIYHEQRSQGEALDRLERVGKMHLDVLADPILLAPNNHGLFQLVGIAALCEVLEPSVCVEPMLYANERYQWLFDRQFSREGIHLEHSPGYHLFALKIYDRIERSGLLELSAANQSVLKAAKENLQHMVHPDGRFAEVGDTVPDEAGQAIPFSDQVAWLRTAGRNGSPPESGIASFPRSGVLSIRSMETDSLLYVTTAHHSRVHKHDDTGSFEWSDRGVRILVDSGKYGYDPGEERDYVVSRAAHNLPVTADVDYSTGDRPSEPVSANAFSQNGVYFVRMELPAPRKLLDGTHERILLFKPGSWLVVADHMEELLPSLQTQWFQFAPTSDLSQREHGYVVGIPGRGSLAVLSLAENDGVRLARGQADPMLGWHSQGYGRLVESWQIGFDRQGRNVRLVTLFRWLPVDEDADVASRWLASRWLASRWKVTEDRISFCWQGPGGLEGRMLLKDADSWSMSACQS